MIFKILTQHFEKNFETKDQSKAKDIYLTCNARETFRKLGVIDNCGGEFVDIEFVDYNKKNDRVFAKDSSQSKNASKMKINGNLSCRVEG